MDLNGSNREPEGEDSGQWTKKHRCIVIVVRLGARIHDGLLTDASYVCLYNTTLSLSLQNKRRGY